jgi:putative transposase
MIDQRINYVHENPVRAMIVEKAEDYLFSSASNYASLGGVIEVEVIC